MKKVEPAAAPGRRANRRGLEAKDDIEALLLGSGYSVQRGVPIGEDIFG